MFEGVHHIAIICSDYQKSKKFYTEVLELEVIREVYREQKNSYKLDLALKGKYIIELFSFNKPPKRPSHPEAQGLRHLAFSVNDIYKAVQQLHEKGIDTEPVKTDPHTVKKFTFFSDPDNIPLELYEK